MTFDQQWLHISFYKSWRLDLVAGKDLLSGVWREVMLLEDKSTWACCSNWSASENKYNTWGPLGQIGKNRSDLCGDETLPAVVKHRDLRATSGRRIRRHSIIISDNVFLQVIGDCLPQLTRKKRDNIGRNALFSTFLVPNLVNHAKPIFIQRLMLLPPLVKS